MGGVGNVKSLKNHVMILFWVKVSFQLNFYIYWRPFSIKTTLLRLQIDHEKITLSNWKLCEIV